MRRLIVQVALLAAPALSLGATGSGTVQFDFTTFSGPMALATSSQWNDPGQWGSTGLVNGVTPTATGWASAGNPGPDEYGYVVGSAALSGGSSADLRYAWDSPGDYRNVISFAPAAFTNVAPGTPFKLGTLTYENGGWYGGGTTATYNTPSQLGFSITTSSADGAAFNQTLTGSITMVVNAPDPNDITTLAGQQAEADWVYFVAGSGGAVAADMGSFRVYDECCKPAGESNIGSVDVMARFGSLDLVSFSNVQGGFVDGSLTPLPPDLPPVPEPATAALLLAGLLGLAGWARYRRLPGR